MKEQPKPSIPDLKNKNGIKGIKKHFVLRHDIDALVSKYSNALHVSQAAVLTEMMLIGLRNFEIVHGFRVAESKYSEDRDENLTQQLDEKYQLLIEQRKKEASKRANDIQNAYSRRVAHTSEGWNTV